MPLIIVTGLPASGKTCRAAQIRQYFVSRGKRVHTISEQDIIHLAGFSKNECFADAQKEKLVRSNLKSEVLRVLNKEDVVIMDGANYIKGFRYEIHCATKSVRTTQCTVYCAITKDQAWDFNEGRGETEGEKYDRNIFDALIQRYEEPQANNRWDSPLFTMFPEDPLHEEGIYNALFVEAALRPNLSTQNAPLSSTNFLFEMDRITQDIINQILSTRTVSVTGSASLNSSEMNIPVDMNASQLNRCRRQFLNYMKLHSTPTLTIDKVPSMFVQFLCTNYNK